MSTFPRPHLDRIIALASKSGAARAAIAFPCSASSIDAAIIGQQKGLIRPIMVGPRKRITEIAEKGSLQLGDMQFVETGDDPTAAARAAVALCHRFD